MATKNEINFSYSTMDKTWRHSVGEMADFTGARNDGDFTITLEEAQRRKLHFISEHLNIKENDRVGYWMRVGTCFKSSSKYKSKGERNYLFSGTI